MLFIGALKRCALVRVPLRGTRLGSRMIAQKTRYALRSLLFLAEEQGGAPVQLGRIAETQRVPPKYLELIMLDLKKAGLVKSIRGPEGRVQLSRAPRTRSRSAKSCARWKGRSRSCPAPASISMRRAAIAMTRRRARSAAHSRSFATKHRGARFDFARPGRRNGKTGSGSTIRGVGFGRSLCAAAGLLAGNVSGGARVAAVHAARLRRYYAMHLYTDPATPAARSAGDVRSRTERGSRPAWCCARLAATAILDAAVSAQARRSLLLASFLGA